MFRHPRNMHPFCSDRGNPGRRSNVSLRLAGDGASLTPGFSLANAAVAPSWRTRLRRHGHGVAVLGAGHGGLALAAYLAAVNVRLVTVIVYALSGLFAAIAGIALTAFGQQATLGMGDPYLFDSIAAVVIGGTSILGGRGNYWGTIAGAIFLVVLRAVLQEYTISEAGRSIATGVVILVALLLYGREAREV